MVAVHTSFLPERTQALVWEPLGYHVHVGATHIRSAKGRSVWISGRRIESIARHVTLQNRLAKGIDFAISSSLDSQRSQSERLADDFSEEL